MNTNLDHQFAAAARAAINERHARFATELSATHRSALRSGCASAIPSLTARVRASLDRDIRSILAHLPPAVKALVLTSAPNAMPELPVDFTHVPAIELAAA